MGVLTFQTISKIYGWIKQKKRNSKIIRETRTSISCWAFKWTWKENKDKKWYLKYPCIRNFSESSIICRVV
jgi:hypothetical protein